jgi:prefoldin subunit 5
MLTTKKVLEDAIKVRENKIKDLEEYDPEFQSEMDFVDSEIENYTLEITELKQSLQIIYDANTTG